MHPRTDDVVIRGPKMHVNSIEETQKRKTPGYFVDDDPFSFRGELIEDHAQQEEENQQPEISRVNARMLDEGGYADQMRNAHAEGVK